MSFGASFARILRPLENSNPTRRQRNNIS